VKSDVVDRVENRPCAGPPPAWRADTTAWAGIPLAKARVEPRVADGGLLCLESARVVAGQTEKASRFPFTLEHVGRHGRRPGSRRSHHSVPDPHDWDGERLPPARSTQVLGQPGSPQTFMYAVRPSGQFVNTSGSVRHFARVRSASRRRCRKKLGPARSRVHGLNASTSSSTCPCRVVGRLAR